MEKSIIIAGKPFLISTLEAIAKEKGWTLDIKENSVLWKCRNKHTFGRHPDAVILGDECPHCKMIEEKAKNLKTIKVPNIFSGLRFELFAFDLNNLIMGWKRKFPQQDIYESDFSQRIKNLFPKHNHYISYFFASNNFSAIQSQFNACYEHRWYIETYLKTGLIQETMDIDPTLTGCISSFLDIYADQIDRFYLGSGDLDLHYVVDVAHEHKIPVTIISLDTVSLNATLERLSNHTHILYSEES